MYALPDGSGYRFELESADHWRTANNDDWAIEVCDPPTGMEIFQGLRRIDGSVCAVFLCQDGRYRAAMEHCCKPLLASEL